MCDQCGSGAVAAAVTTTAASSLRLGGSSAGVGAGVGADHHAMGSALRTEERSLLAEKESAESLGMRSDSSGM